MKTFRYVCWHRPADHNIPCREPERRHVQGIWAATLKVHCHAELGAIGVNNQAGQFEGHFLLHCNS